jgi:hypothetical protein
VEHGVPLGRVRDLLGHASITTTERYDNQTLANLKIAAAKLERGHAFAQSASTVSRFFQDRGIGCRSAHTSGGARDRGSRAG